jgi:hypothetical protein
MHRRGLITLQHSLRLLSNQMRKCLWKLSGSLAISERAARGCIRKRNQ